MRKLCISGLLQAVAGFSAVAMHSVPAHANAPLKVCAANGLCGQASMIDEAQLAAVAGKFTIAGQVVGMSLLMTSSWQAENGQRLEAKANVSIALPSSGKARAAYGTEASATDPQGGTAPGSTGSAVYGSGLQNVNGVSQVIQVAGNGNGASNRASIAVTTGDINFNHGNGSTSASQAAANGAQAAVSIRDNGISLGLTMPGAGIAQQQVNAGNAHNFHQAIQVTADRQQVVNQLQFQVQIRPLDGATQAAQGFVQSLNMLKAR